MLRKHHAWFHKGVDGQWARTHCYQAIHCQHTLLLTHPQCVNTNTANRWVLTWQTVWWGVCGKATCVWRRSAGHTCTDMHTALLTALLKIMWIIKCMTEFFATLHVSTQWISVIYSQVLTGGDRARVFNVNQIPYHHCRVLIRHRKNSG